MAGDVRGEILLARSPRRKPLPPELARAAESNLAGIREGAVSELAALVATGPQANAAAARETLARLAEDDSRRVAAAARSALAGTAPAASPAAPSAASRAAPPADPPADPPSSPPAAEPPPGEPPRR